MIEKYKRYAKINILSILFIAASFMSVTLAWFAYSGLTDVSTEIGVKAWYIKFDKKVDSNNIVISLDDFYPGMETKSEKIKISNLGDSDAQIKYSILSARILNDNLENTFTNSIELEDSLSHDYPFHIDINLKKDFALSGGDESEFMVSVSWPLDSNQDELDSLWGSKSYEFLTEQQSLPVNERKSQIKIVISLKAEQYIGDSTSSDTNYALGNVILYDVNTGKKCNTVSDTCIKTYVIDTNNKLSDVNVNLLPNLYETYESNTFDNYDTSLSNISNNWNVSTRELVIEDVLNIISKDILNSHLVVDNLSDQIIGNLKYEGRINTEVNKAVNLDGYYKYLNEKNNFLVSSKCYWIKNEYNTNKAFALNKIDDNYSKIYGEDKTTSCEVVPIIVAAKSLLESN